ncbi:MAG: hypothetical protein JNL79_03225 [Myxococcales bacterium]|nr:hypothetical protein [Myxococcales bacterium]
MRRALLLVVALGGCDPGPSAPRADAGDARESSPRATACGALAQTLCARLETCAPEYAKVEVGLGALCTTQLRDDCLRRAGLGGSHRTFADLEACGREVSTMACPTFLERYPDVCAPPPGGLLVGASCAFDEQCVTTFCGRGDDTACGTCQAAPAVGEPCVGGACGRGLVCTSARVCERPGVVGDACGPNAPCGRLLFCDFDRCRPRRALDQACGGLGECDPFDAAFCSVTLHCARARSAALGEKCSLSANELTLCTPPARCVDGRCAPALLEGAACGSAGAHSCAGYPPECVRGRCLVRTVETCGAVP